MDDTQFRASLALVGAGFGAAGAAKLASTKLTRDNFARGGYPDPARFVIGAIEGGAAGAAIAGTRSRSAPRRRDRDVVLDGRRAGHPHPRRRQRAQLLPPDPARRRAARVLAGD